MTHGSLFSGIGGFDLAAQWMGWENKFHCEWNEFGQKVLHHYWPDAELFTDITKSNFKKYHGTIDIISGGFPCQPYSMAGKRLGKEDDRHLWPEMLRVIREVRPRWVVGENVLGLVNWNGGLVFEEVQTDLEAQGYEVQPYVLPAAAVNAPHRRDRVWFVAYSNLRGRCRQKGVREYDLQRSQREKSDNNIIASSERLEQRGFAEFAADTNGNGLQRIIQSGCDGEQRRNRPITPFEECVHSCRRGVEKRRWDNFPTESPICSRNDGIPKQLDGITFSKWRNESIKAYGNAVVPQVVLQIFKTIQAYEDLIQNNQNP